MKAGAQFRGFGVGIIDGKSLPKTVGVGDFTSGTGVGLGDGRSEGRGDGAGDGSDVRVQLMEHPDPLSSNDKQLKYSKTSSLQFPHGHEKYAGHNKSWVSEQVALTGTLSSAAS